MVKPQRSEVKIIIFVSPIFYFCCCLGALGVTTCILTIVPPPSLSSFGRHFLIVNITYFLGPNKIFKIGRAEVLIIMKN